MNKKIFVLFTLTLAAGMLLSACAGDTSAASLAGSGIADADAAIAGNAYAGSNGAADNGNGNASSAENGNGNSEAPRDGTHLIAPNGELSEAEIASLNFMREEEKLAQDVYQYLYDLWGNSTFQTIAQSESAHLSAVLSVLNAYGLSDPAAGLEAGQYANPDLQALYNALIERGGQSLAEALKVGAEIEEIDILDLQQRLSETQNEQIQQVYNNLLQGSNSHLRAFVRALQNQSGEVYQPLHLSTEDYQAIMAGSNGNGQSQGGQGQGGQGQGGQGKGGQGQGGQGKGGQGQGGNGQFVQPTPEAGL